MSSHAPAVNIGSIIMFRWPSISLVLKDSCDERDSWKYGTITSIKEAKVVKHNSGLIYTIALRDSSEIIKTRLLHLDWKRISSSGKRKVDDIKIFKSRDSSPNKRAIKMKQQNVSVMSALSYILAPMVRIDYNQIKNV
jgi:hypothetical protein